MEDAVVTVDYFTVGEEEVLVHMGVLIHMVDPNLGAAAQKKTLKRNTGKERLLMDLMNM